ncbi:unnamed protein product [Cuscuta campestris]|uniref:Integrase catalytic domain-containing protein n=1 Tax=Cuscuta campestris TaxID=132261 RepID=A0A484NDV7_9ASTE|nr:unnamed protein product [Cuscuta campestris]
MITYLWRSCPDVTRNPRNGPDPRWSAHEVLAALRPNREVVVEDVAGGPIGEKAGPAGSQGKKKKVRRSQKKKATKPKGKARMEDALSKLDEEGESSSFERRSAFDRLGEPKSKKPRTSTFEQLQDARSARKGDLRETLKERRAESTATSKIGSEEQRKAVEEKEAVELWKMYERLEKRLDAQNPYRQAVFSEVTPFSRRIMSCPLPDNFKTPQIKAYNRTTDPQDHLARFRANVVMYAYPEEIKCRCFLIRKGEQLREFINRWEKEARDVQGADNLALITMLQAALPQGDVRKELRRNPLSTYQEMLPRAKYLALEEEDDEPPVRKEKKSGPQVAEGKKRKDYGKGPNPTGYHANRHPVHAVQSLPAPPHNWESYGEGQEDGRRHLGRDCDDLDEEERQGRRHLGCRFIMGGNTGGDSVSSRKKWKNMVHLAEVQRPPLPKRKKKEPLVFTDEDYPPVLSPHRDALVIKVEINNVVVHPTLVDTGSSVNIMYSNTFKELGLSRSDLKPIRTPLSGFTRDTIEAEGTIMVKAGVRDGTHRLWLDMEFMVVHLDCAHHLILGRPGLEDLECVIYPTHLCLKFNTPTGVGVAKGNQSLSRPCYVRATKSQARVDENVSTICAAIQKEEGRPRAEPADEIEEVTLDPAKPEQKVKVGKTLPPRLKEQLLEVLQAFKVLFAWGPEDMPGVYPRIIFHRLAVDSTHKTVKQKKRFLSSERREFITKQVTTLQSIGHIREVRYPEWDTVLELLKAFGAYRIEQVPREEIAEADILSKLGPDSPEHIKAMTQEEELLEPSISPGQVLVVTLKEPDWIDKITMYILDGSLPTDPIAAKVVKRRAPSYTLECGRLYKRSYNGQPATNYTPISTAIPFARWGIDLVGILPSGTGNNMYLVVPIDYFTKWVEAAPVPTITEEQMRKFVSKQILCRFGVPQQIITENGTQFEARGFNEFLQSWGIKHRYAAVGYPQTNGQVENTNRTIVDGLKKKIMECKSAWVEELPYILWTCRTTPRKATGETPFSLTYGFEARAPAETSLLSYRVETFDAQENAENLRAELHLVDERRERAYI